MASVLAIVGSVAAFTLATTTGAYFKGYGDGKIKQIEKYHEEKDRIRREEFEKFEKISGEQREMYEKRIRRLEAAAEQRPQIIREIINAPATACSVEPVRPDSVRIINEAINRVQASRTGT